MLPCVVPWQHAREEVLVQGASTRSEALTFLRWDELPCHGGASVAYAIGRIVVVKTCDDERAVQQVMHEEALVARLRVVVPEVVWGQGGRREGPLPHSLCHQTWACRRTHTQLERAGELLG